MTKDGGRQRGWPPGLAAASVVTVHYVMSIRGPMDSVEVEAERDAISSDRLAASGAVPPFPLMMDPAGVGWGWLAKRGDGGDSITTAGIARRSENAGWLRGVGPARPVERRNKYIPR